MFLFVPFFLLLLVISDGLSDYIQSPLLFNLLVVVIVLAVMGLVFKVTEGIPQIRAVGECRIDEQGRCFIVMGRYPELRQVTNVYGEPIDYWYKK